MSQVRVKEKVNINDGLPKADPQIVIDELKSHLYSDDNFKKYSHSSLLDYFPMQKKKNTETISNCLIETMMRESILSNYRNY